jgi:nicotinate phosphoribosyltransferase
VHELYSLEYNCHEYGQPYPPVHQEGENRLQEKIRILCDYRALHGVIPSIIDFGTRRRFLKVWQEHVLKEFNDNKLITGTSNLMFAKKFGITAIGTFAHEWPQLFQGLGLCPLRDSQKQAFQAWNDEYRGDLGICLNDTLGNKKFLKDFDMYFAKLFDGCRHDSGPTYEWGDTLINHYEKMKIDPKTKSLVFSDGLDIPESIKLFEYFQNRVKVSFGIGTNLTNDMGVLALQNVMKLIEVNGNPVAKISENPDKTMCENKEFLIYLKSVL